MYTISASITKFGCDPNIVCCFDPSIVVFRLRKTFPDVEVDPQDIAWRAYDFFKQHGVKGDAVRIAERDACRRGPVWMFRLPSLGKIPIEGRAERYYVGISSDEPIPEPLRSRFIKFLQELQFAPYVEVESVQIVGNSHYPA